MRFRSFRPVLRAETLSREYRERPRTRTRIIYSYVFAFGFIIAPRARNESGGGFANTNAGV